MVFSCVLLCVYENVKATNTTFCIFLQFYGAISLIDVLGLIFFYKQWLPNTDDDITYWNSEFVCVCIDENTVCKKHTIIIMWAICPFKWLYVTRCCTSDIIF